MASSLGYGPMNALSQFLIISNKGTFGEDDWEGSYSMAEVIDQAKALGEEYAKQGFQVTIFDLIGSQIVQKYDPIPVAFKATAWDSIPHYSAVVEAQPAPADGRHFKFREEVRAEVPEV